MEVPKRKVTAKVSSQSVPGPASTSPQVVVRAKISSTARSRTTSSAINASTGSIPNINGALRPHVGVIARRSPSPAKMRPVSPSKLQPQLRPATMRAPLTKASAVKVPADHAHQGSISSMLSLTPEGTSTSTVSAPTTPLVRKDTSNIPNGDAVSGDSGSNSIRIKSKVSGLAKPVPSLSTILSPPSPSSPNPLFPSTNRPSRTRATTLASRRPSVSFFVSEPQPSPSHEPPQLFPLPTSPPTSTLSFSSHSSASAPASASTSSTHSHSTSTGLTPPSSYINHTRSESLPLAMLNMQPGDPSLSHDERPASPPPRRLVARIRPGTKISGGRGRGWTSASSVAGDRELGSSDGARMAEMDDRSTDDSERGDEEPRKQRTLSATEDTPENDVQAKAKSNRKIADLEITTRSLLTINASLESSKLRQAREIRELRRKLREARLAMPPGKYRLLTEQERGKDDDRDAEEDEEDEEEDGKDDGDEGDEGFRRVRTLVEGLLAAGRSALAVPASPSFLSAQPGSGADEPSPSSAAGCKLGLGIDTGPMAGTRMDQGEVLGWDVGSSLGTEAGSGGGAESGSRRWKHGVAIGSKVLSPEEAKPWVGEEGENEEEDEEGQGGARDEVGHSPDRVVTHAADDALSDTLEDVDANNAVS